MAGEDQDRGTTWAIMYCQEYEWEGCEPGWYWGDLEIDEYGHGAFGDSTGPFEGPGAAALDMTRTFIAGAVAREGSN